VTRYVAKVNVMDSVWRIRRLVRIGVYVAIGALVLGLVGVALAHSGAGVTSAAILISPGFVLLASSVWIIITALRTPPKFWKSAYARSAMVLQWGAALGAFLTIGAAVTLGTQSAPASTLQIVLITAVGLQGPLAMALLARSLTH
jgi:hypothetical protein